MFGKSDRNITVHWDQMSEKERTSFLETRAAVRAVTIACLFLSVTILGGIALEPGCERAETEQDQQLESLVAYQKRQAFQHCITRCTQYTSNEGECPEKCGEAIKSIEGGAEGHTATLSNEGRQ